MPDYCIDSSSQQLFCMCFFTCALWGCILHTCPCCFTKKHLFYASCCNSCFIFSIHLLQRHIILEQHSSVQVFLSLRGSHLSFWHFLQVLKVRKTEQPSQDSAQEDGHYFPSRKSQVRKGWAPLRVAEYSSCLLQQRNNWELED